MVQDLFNKLGLRWYFVTRGVGLVLVVYGLLVDHTPERGTILVGGFGLIGLDKVARSEPHHD